MLLYRTLPRGKVVYLYSTKHTTMFDIHSGRKVIQEEIIKQFGLYTGQLMKFEELWNHFSERGWLQYSYGIADVHMTEENQAVKRIEVNMVSPEVKNLFGIKYSQEIENAMGRVYKIAEKITMTMNSDYDNITLYGYRLRKDEKTWYLVPNILFIYNYDKKYEAEKECI